MTTTLGRNHTLRQRSMAFVGAFAIFASLIAVFAPVASASIDISIPITTVVDAKIGSETLLATVPTGEFEGQVCSVKADATNQESVHPGNDLVVASDDSFVVLEDVESSAGGTVHADGTLTLSDVVTVTLINRESHLFSAGITVLIDCTPVTQEASVTVTANSCDVDDQGVPVGSVDVDISPDSGATVTVYSDAGLETPVADFSGSGGSADLSPGTYYWDASAEAGYTLTGDTSGSFTIIECEGSVIVSSGDCTVGPEGEDPGFVNVTIDPDTSATVTVYDSDDNVVETFTSSGSATLVPGDYSWSAVPSTGFVLTGATTGDFTVVDCSDETEVSDLEITKIDLVDPVTVDTDNPTALITYEITVTNNGPSVAENVVVTDTLPGSLTYVSASPETGTCSHAGGVVTCDLGDMAVGASVKITVVVETESVGTVSDLNPVNTVVVSSDTEDNNPDNNTDDEDTSIIEVLDTEVEGPDVLPFTGIDSDMLLVAALAMLGLGSAVLWVTYAEEQEEIG